MSFKFRSTSNVLFENSYSSLIELADVPRRREFSGLISVRQWACVEYPNVHAYSERGYVILLRVTVKKSLVDVTQCER